MEAAPDYAAFAPSGALFVTDIEQALIWRVPPGGGRPIVWLTDPRLESVFGPNGMQVVAGGRALMFASTSSSPATGHPASGALYTVPLGRRARHERELTELWLSQPVDGPDGFAVGRSGNAYVALAGANQLAVISPAGEELARVPANPLANAGLEVPFDGPASIAFAGRRLLVTNQSFARGDPSSWAVLDVYAGERGLPLFYP
jgi:sugar lactone lactonase YvrE